MVKKLYEESNIQAIANSIRAKNGETTTYKVSEMSTAIDNIPSGGDPKAVDEKDINFIDIGGTILYSYTVEEFLELTELPPLPTREFMTYDEWNWTLEGAKESARIIGKMFIGAVCHTTNGEMRLYVKIEQYAKSPTLLINLNGSATVDWGDDSEIDTISGTSLNTAIYKKHVYSKSGDYCIIITPSEGSEFGFSRDGGYFPILCEEGVNNSEIYLKNISKLYLPLSFVKMGYYCFYLNGNTAINIPTSIKEIGEYPFACNSCCIFPNTTNLQSSDITSEGGLNNKYRYISNSEILTFQDERGLQYASNPTEYINYNVAEGIQTFYERHLGASSLKLSTFYFGNAVAINNGDMRAPQCDRIIYKATVWLVPRNIKIYQLYNATSCRLLDLRNVPVFLALNTNEFVNWTIPDYKIVVPDNLYNEYIVASYWSEVASHIIKASDYES